MYYCNGYCTFIFLLCDTLVGGRDMSRSVKAIVAVVVVVLSVLIAVLANFLISSSKGEEKSRKGKAGEVVMK